MRNIHIFYHINLESNSAGGVLNFLNGLCKKLVDDYSINYYSMKYDFNKEIDNRINNVFVGNGKINPNVKTIIPHNLKYIISLIKTLLKRDIKLNFDKDDIIIINRIDHMLPLILRKNKKIMIVHGSSEFDDMYYSKYSLKKVFLNISEKLAIKYVDKIVLVSKDAYIYYKNKYKNFSYKFIYIPTFYDSKIFFPNDKIIKNEEIRYIYTGRFEHEKGMNELLEYVNYLDDNDIKYKLTLIGEGSYKDKFKDKKNVNIVGKISQSNIREYLSNSDIFLLFSKFEGTPLSLIESMSVGTPAITSYGGELKNIIQNGFNGFKFKNITNEHKNILEKSYEIKKQRFIFKENCIKYSSKFEIEEVYCEYKNLIEDL